MQIFQAVYQKKVRFPLGPVAQWLERSAHNRLVAGSIPAGPTIIKGTTLICLN